MRTLNETSTVLAGQTMRSVVLGKAELMEKLVEWSKEAAPGETFTKETIWGLKLDFIANGEKPFITVFIDETRLATFLNQLGPVSELSIDSYGVSLVGPMEPEGEAEDGSELIVGICMRTDGCRELWRRDPSREQGVMGLGAISVQDDGIKYMTQTELAEFIAEATVQASQMADRTEPADESVEAWEQQAEDEGEKGEGDLDEEIAHAIERQCQMAWG